MFSWIPVSERLPTHIYTVVLHVTGGPLHFGEDYIDVGSYFPDAGEFRTAIRKANGGVEDMAVEVSHWLDVDHPNGGCNV